MPFASIMRATTATFSGGAGGSGEGGNSSGSTPAPGTMVTAGEFVEAELARDRRCSRTDSACSGPRSHRPTMKREHGARGAGSTDAVFAPQHGQARSAQAPAASRRRARAASPPITTMRSAMQCTMSGRLVAHDPRRCGRSRATPPSAAEAAPLVLQRARRDSLRPRCAPRDCARASRPRPQTRPRRAVRAIGRKCETKNQSSVTR